MFPVLKLNQWFSIFGRSLPWRENRTPYRVWVAEVMLQQTQASVVIPYFHLWMSRFPTLESLASAELADVIKLWEGLGYYSRARQLHEGAKHILKNFDGKIPDSPKHLASIKGIGPYTQGAILSFAYRKKAAAIDGNVNRLLTRFFAIDSELQLTKTKNQLQSIVNGFLPDKEPWVTSEALIELGALICQKKPKCKECPIKQECQSFKNGNPQDYPKKKKGPKITSLYRIVAVIIWDEKVLLQQGAPGKVMQDLFEFPFTENLNHFDPLEMSQKMMEERFGLSLVYSHALPEVEHGFTRYQAFLRPFVFKVSRGNPLLNWKREDELEKLAFSAGHKRILNHLKSDTSP